MLLLPAILHLRIFIQMSNSFTRKAAGWGLGRGQQRHCRELGLGWAKVGDRTPESVSFTKRCEPAGTQALPVYVSTVAPTLRRGSA